MRMMTIIMIIMIPRSDAWPRTRAGCQKSHASRVRLKGYDGPCQSSEHFMMALYFGSTSFSSTQLAY